ncbi:MAG: site-specific DNA-methyltransferase [Candidatus Omnitrophica bacterium]|nr:site-specific DNA-methyltransferase [Candidatus Omnitrophota bacterium]
MLSGSLEDFFKSGLAKKYYGKVQLIFTSPPFPLNRKKKYGNFTGEEYLTWLSNFAAHFKRLLKPNGSIVMEIGNSWLPQQPVMSTLAIESLLQFVKKGKLHLCQQFICNNPARLPSPAQWVTIERIRVKDSFTHVWWMAKSARPKANNRNVLKEYSKSMKKLLESQKYNAGKRPSGHHIGKESFLSNNKGAIPSNVITLANTKSNDNYQEYCRKYRIPIHPARMQIDLAKFFINFLTSPKDLVFDPFAGSNTTGSAAEILKRRWISVEINKDYLKGSRGRFNSKVIL